MSLPAADERPETPVAEPRVDRRDADRPGDQVGVYRLLEGVGRTAASSVWLAERSDGHFEREVALKLLHPPADGAAVPTFLAWTERMAAERKLALRLDHPNLARVFDAGVDARGRPYMVTVRVLGNDLVRHARRRNLPAKARLALLLQACSAVAHVHGLQWAHGRLKPSNLRVDDEGRVLLLDTGMSRLLAGWRSGTAGVVKMPSSPDLEDDAFVAPEHRTGDAPTVAQDVYALGVFLRELMVRAPGSAAMRRDLHAVLARAMAQDPMQRYATVVALAADVECLAQQRAVNAAKDDRLHAGLLWLRRHRTAMSVGAALTTLLLAVSAGSWQQQQRARGLDDRDRRARAFMADALPSADRSAQRWQAALTRARQGFEGEPALRGQVLAELGVAARAIGQPEGALQALSEAHALLQNVAPADDPARLGAAAEWASQGILNGRPEAVPAATAWADQALRSCRLDSDRCALTRASAHFALSLAARARNDTFAQQQALERQASEVATARRLAPAND